MYKNKICLLILSIILHSLTFSQEDPKTVIIDKDTLVVSAIPISNVSAATEEVYKEIKTISDKLNSYQDQHVFDSLAEIGSKVINKGEEDILSSIDDMSEREIIDAQNDWKKNRSILNSWRDKFSARMVEMDAMYQRTDFMQQNWTLTLEKAKKQEVVDQLKINIENTLKDIQKINNEVKSKQNQFYLNQNTVTEFSLKVDKILELLDEKSSALRLLYFKADAPPAWAASDSTGNLNLAITEFRKYKEDSYKSALRFIEDSQAGFIFQLLLFFILLALIFSLNRFSHSIKDISKDIEFSKSIISFFFFVALFLTLYSSIWIYHNPPSFIQLILKFLLIITSFSFFQILFKKSVRANLVIGLLILFLLDETLHIVGGKAFIFRVVLYFEAIIAALILIYAVRKIEPKLRSLKVRYWALFSYLVPVFVILTIAVLIGNTFGFVNLSIVLINTVVHAIFDALILIILTIVLNSIVIVSLETRYIQTSNIVREYKTSLAKWITSAINIVTISIWLFSIIKNLRFDKVFWTWVNGLLDISWSIGATTVSLGKIITVLLVIAVTVALVKLVSILLSKEVFPRVQLPRGVPGAISMIIRYTIVGFGFYFVLSAAGIDLGKFGLIAGALGVGIGFGLQNIVYNFIAGLVLAFERPIQVGDVIEVGTLLGTVTSIGVRSSNVKTFDGSEVIVPNGNLISKEVINWTLSDRKKRREISVDVAYGSDPREVLEILLKTANENVNVLETPAPWATFEGFGDSALNFKIRFWVPFDVGISTKSQIAMSIYDALNDAGIKIPFPQQDVYIKSVDKNYRDVTEQRFNTPGFKNKPDDSDKKD